MITSNSKRQHTKFISRNRTEKEAGVTTAGHATMNDVAREAGVSIATVSYVINRRGKVSPATTQRVLRAIQDLSYAPNVHARKLARFRKPIIGSQYFLSQ